jgi:hypothetical protein
LQGLEVRRQGGRAAGEALAAHDDDDCRQLLGETADSRYDGDRSLMAALAGISRRPTFWIPAFFAEGNLERVGGGTGRFPGKK